VDGFTPVEMAPGAPVGSFPLSGFENVNLYSGNLNFHLPLLRMEGRGEAAYTTSLAIERHWYLKLTNPKEPPSNHRYAVVPNAWFQVTPGLGVGTMNLRRGVQDVVQVTPGVYLETSLTRLTYTAADGTEHEFRDTDFGGRPQRTFSNQLTNRRRIFLAADGTAAMYLADQDVYDGDPQAVPTAPAPGGSLYLRDGTRYRIGPVPGDPERSGPAYAGMVTQIIDRNGNLLDVYGSGGLVTKVRDSLGRTVTIEYATDPGGQPEQTIHYQGFRGTPREVTVHYDLLSHRLRGPTPCEGGGICRNDELFAGIGVELSAPEARQDYLVVASAELPNLDTSLGGRTRYDFNYDEYGHLSQVQLPTGGIIEYAWGSGYGTPFSVNADTLVIVRRVTSRKVYNYDALEQWTQYTPCPADPLVRCVEVKHLSPSGAPLGREEHFFNAHVLRVEPCSYPDPLEGRELYSRIYEGNGSDWVRQISNDWEEGAPIPCAPGVDCSSLHLAANIRLKRVVTQLDDRQQSKVEYDHDDFNNVTSKREFDYGANAPSRTTDTTYEGSPYDFVSLPHTETVSDAVGQRSKTTFVHDEGDLLARPGIVGWTASSLPRGNVTRTIRHLDSPGPGETSDVVTERKYDQAGNVWRIKDPLGHETTLFYDDNFGPPDGAAQPQEEGRNTFAFPTLMRNALRHETRRQYDYSTGQVVEEQDANGTVTSFYHDDPLDRLTLVEKAANPGYDAYLSRTGFEYKDGRYFRGVKTFADKDQAGDAYVQHWVWYDQLGRDFLLRTRDAGQNDGSWIEVAKGYDARGRVSQVSNPHNEKHDLNVLWTSTQYDILDRPIRVTTPDQAAVVTHYSGNQTTVYDQTGRARSSITDALGRVSMVIEDPDGLRYETSYGYDGLDQLTGMQQGKPSQGTTQSRTFSYDTLGRLRRASNPESGDTRYEYDLAGNLRERTDARGVKTVTDYDLLNRPMTRTYNDGTPGVTYTYDEDSLLGSYPRGRLTRVGNAYSETDYHHDPLGRVFRSSQKTITERGIVTYGFVYGYNRQDHLVSEQYPSGRVVKTAYDDQIRVTKVSDALNTYASDFTYWVHGAPMAMKLGNGLWETTNFNTRLQPTLMGLGTASGVTNLLSLGYEYWPEGAPPSLNNGDVFKQTITLPGASLTQRYSYDGVNRLATAQEASAQPWSQTYGYDRFGNRVVTAGFFPQPGLTPTNLALHYDAFTNRIKMGASASPDAYDAAGNQLADPLGRVSSYDAENRQSSTNGGGTTYGYDGESRRVLKTVEGVTTFFVYDAQGRLAAEYAGQSPAMGTRFLTQDPLGSVRVVTDANMTVVARHDYFPFGEEIPKTLGRTNLGGYGTFDAIRQRFTGKERDTESGLDYFGARYFSGAQGRFTTVDLMMSSGYPANPQSWNRYAYTYNNPLKHVDPTGQAPCCVEDALDFVDGAIRGAAATISMGTMPGSTPQSSDSTINLVGQVVGTAAVSVTEMFLGGTEAVVTTPAAATGVGVVAPAIGLAVAVHGASSGALNMAKINQELNNAGNDRSYETYTKTKPETEEVYSGRTSGTGTPEQNIARRNAGHHMNNEGFGPAVLDKSSSNKAAIRGREQQLIDANGGAQSQGGTSGNRINAISDKNRNKACYLAAACKEFGSEK
jgi:RHS repeat-associated protein